jgi:coenzyme PQQ synthesis protein D (PqqD)
MKAPHGFLPAARREGIIRKEVDGELLVYDLERNKAHCLNESAAAIWNLCDGQTSIQKIAASLTKEVGTTVDERLVWLALADLRRTHLLEELRHETQVTRRTASDVEPPDTKAESSPVSPDGQPGWGGRRRTPKGPREILGMSRREAVKRIGLGAAIALPVVISITAPTPAQALSCVQQGGACSTSAECCAGLNCPNGGGTCQ